MAATEPKIFPVVFHCEGRATGKMRNELDVRVESPWKEEFDPLATDEGAFHGGEATAPPPLALFIAGFSGCIMTQIRAFAKRLEVDIESLNIHATARWEAVQYGLDPYVSAPKGFQIDIDLKSSAEDEKIDALIKAACKGCFIDQTISQVSDVRHRLLRNGEWVDIEVEEVSAASVAKVSLTR